MTLLAANPELEEAKASLQEGPIDFVCTRMQLFSEPNRTHCHERVVVRRGDLLLCCEFFEGYMNDKGGWERLICSRRVRAQRHGELMWADRATFIMATNDLILTGRPVLQRGQSILKGERIVVDTERDQAHIEQPRGRLAPAVEEPGTLPPGSGPAPVELPLTGELPRRCPIPHAPAGHRAP